MDTPRRPLPEIDEPDTGPFWAAAQEHRLTYQVCVSCDSVVFYPRAHCTNCGTQRLEVRESEGYGTVYSYTVIHQTPDPAFRGDLPFTMALVDLAEGFRILTRLEGEGDGADIGQPVVLDWRTFDDFEFPVFTALAGDSAAEEATAQ